MKKNCKIGTIKDLIKANRKASREEEFELLGPGFHSKDHVCKSKKIYTRKQKHKNGIQEN